MLIFKEINSRKALPLVQGYKCKSPGNADHWSTYKKFNNKVKDELCVAYHHYVNNLTDSLSSNPKKFWSFVESHTGLSSVLYRVALNTQCIMVFKVIHLNLKLMSSVYFFNLCLIFTNHVIRNFWCSKDQVAKVLADLQ